MQEVWEIHFKTSCGCFQDSLVIFYSLLTDKEPVNYHFLSINLSRTAIVL